MILPKVQTSRGDLHHLLGFVKNEKRDVLRRKFGILAVKRLPRGRVAIVAHFDVLWHIFFYWHFCFIFLYHELV